ncbi:MAG: AAA family ATPase [Acidimicrobiaceae bacterium]|nr:AAA family ATPase [Acidimicrobiaceae bacterium]
MTHPDVPAEQAHVDHAYRRLEAMRAAASSMLAEAFSEKGSTFQSFTERDIRVRTGLSRLEQLQIGRESLVFGRIDRRKEAGRRHINGDGVVSTDGAVNGEGTTNGDGPTSTDGDTEAFHIGRLAISDEHQEPLVVDWRAPVAEPFYRATGAHPMGLARRRHFLTDGPRVLDLEDELFDEEGSDEGAGLGLSGPQILLSTLERSRTGRMRDIVATVQREQDEIIRGGLSGILVVQGGPGTGKTAVALHRAAYLLYTHRFPLEGQGVLVVGPNPTFLRYIGHVLPSLGESGVELSTISGLLPDVEPAGAEERVVARLKGDPRMARFVMQAVADRQRPLRRPVEIPYGSRMLRLSTAASEQIVSSVRRRPGTHNARRRAVETLLWRHLLAQLERRVNLRPGHPSGADLTPLQFNGNGAGADADPELPTAAELGRELRRLPEVAEALDRMWPLLTPQQLLHDLFGAPPLLQLAARGVLDPSEASLLRRPRASELEAVRWTEADVPLLDEARALLGPLRRRANPGPNDEPDGVRTYGHIVVDEAQDLSPMQLRMLGRRSLGGSMTVVGDMAQATGSWAPSKWADIVAHLPAERGWRQVELTVNYRTPEEIMDLAGRVLAIASPGMVPPAAVRSSGQPPVLVDVSDPIGAATAVETRARLVDAVVRVAGEELSVRTDGGTLGVIVPPSLVEAVATALEQEGLPFGRVGAGALDSDLTLLSVEDAKGLEFDSIVVVEPSRMAAESARGYNSVYVALTRATHRLTIVQAEGLPPALADADIAVSSEVD